MSSLYIYIVCDYLLLVFMSSIFTTCIFEFFVFILCDYKFFDFILCEYLLLVFMSFLSIYLGGNVGTFLGRANVSEICVWVDVAIYIKN